MGPRNPIQTTVEAEVEAEAGPERRLWMLSTWCLSWGCEAEGEAEAEAELVVAREVAVVGGGSDGDEGWSRW